MYGIDLSNYQRSLDLESKDINFDFAIIKATEGTNFQDPSFKKFALQLTKMNKLIGCYHFARPDNRKSADDMVNEAKWFLDVVKEAGLLNKTILCLDYETAPYEPAMAKIWLDYVSNNSNSTPFIYGSYSVLQKFASAGVLKNCKIWMAKWPSIERYLVGDPPGLSLPSKAKVPYDIWQYSSNGYVPSYAGRIDLDYTSLSKESWKLLANISSNAEILSPDMKWAVEAGLFQGYPDGLYKPSEPVTRSALATVLHRFWKNVISTEYSNYYVDSDSVKKKESDHDQ